jgi:hypothetical protein
MLGNEQPCPEVATAFCVLKTEAVIQHGKVHPLIGTHRCLCDNHKDKDPDFCVLGPLSHGVTIMCQWGRDLQGKVA